MDRRDFIKSTLAAAAAAAIPFPLKALAKRDAKNLRSVEVYRKGSWWPLSWADLKKDDIFRLREPDDGSIADAGTDWEISVAMNDAIPQPAPMFHSIEVEPFTHITMDHPLVSRIQAMKDGSPLGYLASIDVRTMQAEQVDVPEGTTWGYSFMTTPFWAKEPGTRTITFDDIQLLPA